MRGQMAGARECSLVRAFFSTTTTRRLRLASPSATHNPTGPAPTTHTSQVMARPWHAGTTCTTDARGRYSSVAVTALAQLLERARQRRSAHLFAAILRILLGFAFVPAGLKKVLAQPFTDPANTGAFHEFLHAFHATGPFYQFVGVVQLTIATLLMTQRLAHVGALMALPVFTTIAVFCWSTAGHFTSVMVTLMALGAASLVVWDLPRWRQLLNHSAEDPGRGLIDQRMWQWCGAAILVVYLAICAYSGGIYRPRGVELGNPAFYIFPLIALFPVVTWLIERRARRR